MSLTIGKYTLESLTSGMYQDPFVIYREYIQNSIDSIDDAIDIGLISVKQSEIIVEVDSDGCSVSICDNGLGIPANQAENFLLDIGNSKKSYKNRRGFRGIGRLSGLSYADTLLFETSSYGELISTQIRFDAKKLRKLLTPGQNENYDLKTVLESCIQVSSKEVEREHHFFKVTLNNVKGQDGLLDKDVVMDYLAETVPVPYNEGIFSFSSSLHEEIAKVGYDLPEYNIFVCYKRGNSEKVFKHNRDVFLSDRQRKLWDELKDIRIKRIYDKDEKIIGLVWFGMSNCFGTILSERLKGIRFRKGNILVGNKVSLNNIFKEERFNGWLQGEVFVLDERIIPNARRDDFEGNQYYQYLLRSLEEIFQEASKRIRELSIRRMKQSQVVIDNADNNVGKLQKELEIHDHIMGKKVDDNIIKDLNALQGRSAYKAKYDVLNASMLTVSEKKMVEKFIDILQEKCPIGTRKKLINAIMTDIVLKSG